MAYVRATRQQGDTHTCEWCHYISSLPADAKRINHAIRSHWLVKNALHWVMDVTFKEDQSLICRGLAAENLLVIQHVASDIPKKETFTTSSILRKARKDGSHDDYRSQMMML